MQRMYTGMITSVARLAGRDEKIAGGEIRGEGRMRVECGQEVGQVKWELNIAALTH